MSISRVTCLCWKWFHVCTWIKSIASSDPLTLFFSPLHMPITQDIHLAKRYYDMSIAHNPAAALPANLALIKIHAKLWQEYAHEVNNRLRSGRRGVRVFTAYFVSCNLLVLRSKQTIQCHVWRKGLVSRRRLGHLPHRNSLRTASDGNQMAHEMKQHSVTHVTLHSFIAWLL